MEGRGREVVVDVELGTRGEECGGFCAKGS